MDGPEACDTVCNNLQVPVIDLENSISLKLTDAVSNPLIILDCDVQPLLLAPKNEVNFTGTVFEIITHEDLNASSEEPTEEIEMVDMQVSDKPKEEQPKEINSEQTVFMCGDCSLVFPLISQIHAHINSHHKKPGKRKLASTSRKKVKTSTQADYSTQTEDSKQAADKTAIPVNGDVEVAEEQEEHNCPDLIMERPFKCAHSNCGAKFTTEEKLAEHIEMHTANGLQCPKCPKFTSIKWPSLAAHLWKSHCIEHDMYKCSVCKYKSGSRSHLLKHYCTHWEGGGESACRQCGHLCKSPNELVRHISLSHPNQSAKSGGSKRTCNECGLELADARCLRRHIKCVHGAVRPYVCGVCDYSAKTRHTLVLHARQHSYDRPFSCNKCPFTSRDHNTMRRHKQRHNGERPYSCLHCSYSATQSTTLLGHLSRCHPNLGGAHHCPSCTFTTVSAKLMDAHARTVHPEGRSNKCNTDEQNRNFSSMFPSSINASEIVRNYPSGIEDDESSSQCYFDSDHVDTGGITIPAEGGPDVLQT